MFFGILVVIVVGILLFKYFRSVSLTQNIIPAIKEQIGIKSEEKKEIAEEKKEEAKEKAEEKKEEKAEVAAEKKEEAKKLAELTPAEEKAKEKKEEKAEEKKEEIAEKKEEAAEEKKELAEEKKDEKKEEAKSAKEAELESLLASERMERKIEKKMSRCKAIVSEMADRDMIEISDAAVDEEKKAGLPLLDARHEAFKKSVDKQLADLMKMDDNTVEAFANSVKRMKRTANNGKGLNISRVPYNTEETEGKWLSDLFDTMG